jgi:hypothetical protein
MDHVVEESELRKVRKLSEWHLLHCRGIGGTWAVYENQQMDSSHYGDMICVRFGPDCTYKTPPEHAPDGHYGAGWKYRYVGMADLESGEVRDERGT